MFLLPDPKPPKWAHPSGPNYAAMQRDWPEEAGMRIVHIMNMLSATNLDANAQRDLVWLVRRLSIAAAEYGRLKAYHPVLSRGYSPVGSLPELWWLIHRGSHALSEPADRQLFGELVARMVSLARAYGSTMAITCQGGRPASNFIGFGVQNALRNPAWYANAALDAAQEPETA